MLQRSPQNLKVGELPKPHFGHIVSNFLPHSAQNFMPSGFSVEHFGHFIFDIMWMNLCLL